MCVEITLPTASECIIESRTGMEREMEKGVGNPLAFKDVHIHSPLTDSSDTYSFSSLAFTRRQTELARSGEREREKPFKDTSSHGLSFGFMIESPASAA